ncbi:SPOR domain-containing protein [Roseovarius sp. LXJ103]|nr:SPOR domain-containing protein [Roseovarius carneus]PWE37206.1 SPOR domain-containing protein [Pelagicola sp. LXJ1103]
MQADGHWSGEARGTRGQDQVSTLSKLTYWVASAISLGLMIGLGVWGYKLMARDVSGVPVIRAAEGPMRVQPEEPGGQQAANQGLSVNGVAATGTAASAPDELILAPAPLDLTLEDDPTLERVQTTSLQTATTPETAPSDVTQAAPEMSQATAPATDEEAAMLALAEALSQDVPPLSEVVPEANLRISTPISGGIGSSLRPKARPSGVQAASLSNGAPSSAQSARQDVAAADIPVGTRLAQLGAFKSEAIALEEWARLEARFEDVLSGKGRVIQRAESGGRTFYRLRAIGFEDLADARRFCSALVAERAECIPVVTR